MPKKLVPGVLFLSLWLIVTHAAAAPICVQGIQTQICGTETRITTNLADQFDPAISGNIIVYSDARGPDLDIWYYDLSKGQEYPVTTLNGDQQLPNVWGQYVVYSDTSRRQVDLFNIQDGTMLTLAGVDAPATDPAVGDSLAVWEDRRYGPNSQVMAYEMASGTVKRISDSSNVDQFPAVSGRTLVWQRCDGTVCSIWTSNWDTGVTQQITDPSLGDAQLAAIDSNIIVYQAVRAGAQNIYAFDLTSNTERKLALAGASDPHIRGDFVVLEDGAAPVHLKLWYLPTDEVFDLSNISVSSSQFLSNIDLIPADGQNPAKTRIVYTDDRSGQLDIYMYEFTWGPAATAPVFGPMPSPVVEATSPAGAVVTYTVTASNQDGPATVSCSPASGSTFPLGTAVDTCVATDPKNSNLASTASFNVVVRDTTPPVLNLPSNVVANAASPSGATVAYIVSAVDLVDPNPAIVCKPGSGTTFAIGDTSVSCTAADFSGNKSSGSFNVHVKGAPEQIADLEVLVASYPLKGWVEDLLEADLRGAAAALGNGKGCSKTKACLLLDAFILEVNLLTGKEITQSQALAMLAAAGQIRKVIGCL